MPGATRQCRRCDPNAETEPEPTSRNLKCVFCTTEKPQQAFPSSAVHHRADKTQRALCYECCRPKCTNPQCQTCKICRREECSDANCTTEITSLNSQLLPKSEHERDTWECLKCSLMVCDICEKAKPLIAFPSSALDNRHRNTKTRNCRCLDCSRPPCIFLPKCKTCIKCRGDSCLKGPTCTKEIKTLNLKQLPKTKEEVTTYSCTRCRYVRCTVIQPDGSRCGKERRAHARASAKQRQEEYNCGDCLTWMLSQTTLQKAKASAPS